MFHGVRDSGVGHKTLNSIVVITNSTFSQNTGMTQGPLSNDLIVIWEATRYRRVGGAICSYLLMSGVHFGQFL